MASTKRARIFISYKRVEPDTSVAREIFEALSQQQLIEKEIGNYGTLPSYTG
jgi:hypothetical protein